MVSEQEVPLDLSSIQGADAALSEYGLSADTLRDSMIQALQTGHVGFPLDISSFRADPAKRLKFTQTMAPIVRKAAALPSFKQAYARARALAIQSARGADHKARSAQEIHNDQAAELQRGISELEKQLKDPSIPAEMRKALQDGIAAQRKMLDQLKGDSSMARQAAEGERQEAIEEQRRAEERAREVSAAWPADHRELLKKRLRELLELSNDIDWNAKLVNDGGRKRFANPAFEQKDPRWKMLFRAGRPAVDALRSFSKDWLAELH